MLSFLSCAGFWKRPRDSAFLKMATYAPLNIEQQLQVITDRLDRIIAATQNNRILSRNARQQAPQPLAPLQKEVSHTLHTIHLARLPYL
jgi:hypothetical protein